ncbi:MAG: 2,3-bisphosphoglycerate-independent phosphoglycerate mutase [Gammaproteobacteria bacterium]|nr:2,3-bisphosphoglycerate-independent phosphoglycerate mutase [Gammaproteobacteria bacterium]
MSAQSRPLVLIILDGWGDRENTPDNAITAARKPNWGNFLSKAPHTTLAGAGLAVGLPQNQMGNSEVGHLNMGAGRIVHQDLTRIDLEIETGDFFQNKVLVDALKLAKNNQKAVHVLGLFSPGGVHSHEMHWFALHQLAVSLDLSNLYLHPFLDGRDTPPQSALVSLQRLDALLEETGCGHIASLIGRYYAMDRDHRWERIEAAYKLLIDGQAAYHADTAAVGLEQAYARGENDEFVQATIVSKNGIASPIKEGDVVIFMNFRADRARELTEALTDPQFKHFKRNKIINFGEYVCLSTYDQRFDLPVAYPPIPLNNLLAECISDAGLRQLRIAETEKYAHVTFFFNGGIEKPFPLEERVLVPSPKVATYDLQPEMSAPLLTKKLIEAIESHHFDVIICNFANPDMVGHTGNFPATVKAIEVIDTCLGDIARAVEKMGGEMIITADHGNAEQMFDLKTNQPHTAHTTDPVPFIFLGRPAKIVKKDGKLSDIAPTMLYLLDQPIPVEMTGKPLIELV